MENYLTDQGRKSKTIRWILGHPYLTLLASLLTVSLLMGLMVTKYNIDVDFSYRTWFEEKDPLLKEFDAFERKYGNDDAIVLAVHSDSGIYDTETVELLRNLTRDIWQVHDVIRVDSLTNYNWVHGKGNQILVEPLLEPEDGNLTPEFLESRKNIALNDETIPDYLMSRDTKTAVMFARIKPAIVNYKRALSDFIDNGKIKDDLGSFATLFQQERGVTGSGADDSLLAADDSLEDETEGGDGFLDKVRDKRNEHIRGIIAKIAEKEKEEKSLLSYDQVLSIISDSGWYSLANLENQAPEKLKEKIGELADQDQEDVLKVLWLNEKEKSANYQQIVSETRAVVKKYHKKGDHTIFITGGVYLSDSFRESTQRDLSVMLPITLLMILVFLMINFKTFTGKLLYTIIGISVTIAIGSIAAHHDLIANEGLANSLKMLPGMMIGFLLLFFITRLVLESFDKIQNKKAGGIIQSLLVVFSSIFAILGIMGITGFRFNNMPSIVPYILIAIGIADSVHIMVTFYQFMNRGLSKVDAAFLSLRKNFIPTLLTSVSTAMGFISFGTSKVEPIANMGILAAIGTLFAWVFTYTILGPLLKTFPATADKKMGSGEPDIKTLGPNSIRIAEWINHYKKPIMVSFGIVALFSIVVSVNHRVNSDPFAYFREGSDLRKSLEFMEKAVGAATGVEISIQSGKAEGIKEPAFLNKVEELQNWIYSRKDETGEVFTTKTVSIIEILKAMNRTLNGGDQDYYRLPGSKEVTAEQLFLYTMNLPEGMDINDRMTIKNDSMRLTVLWKLHDSNHVLGEIAEIKKQAEKIGLKIDVTGKQVLFPSLNPYVVNSFIVSITMAVILVSVLLMIAFRSVKLGLLAMIPNAIPLFFGSAAIWLAGKDLDMGMVIVFSICLGIAVDDTIHFLENYRKALSEGKTPLDAVKTVFTFTAPALVTTTMVLVASFGTFILATFVPNINFGIFTAFILSLALLTDMFFLPALLIAIGKDESQANIT